MDELVISKLEKLAKLKLDKAERKAIGNNLDKMLKMVDKLSEVDTTGVEPLIYMHEETNVLRKDETTNMLSRDEALANAPRKDSVYFAVPKIINK